MFYHFDTHTETIIYKYKWVFIDYPHLKVTEWEILQTQIATAEREKDLLKWLFKRSLGNS